MNIPNDLKYTSEHEWAKIEGDTATLGITDFAQDQLGDVVFVELPKLGQQIKQKEEFGVVESVKSVSSLYAPLSGEVLAINEALKTAASAINKEPYGSGWIAKVKISNKEEVSGLLSAEQYIGAISE